MTRTAVWTADEGGEWMSCRRAAEALGVSVRDVYKTIASEQLRCRRVGRLVEVLVSRPASPGCAGP